MGQHIFGNTHNCCQHYISFPISVLLFRYMNNIGPHIETVKFHEWQSSDKVCERLLYVIQFQFLSA